MSAPLAKEDDQIITLFIYDQGSPSEKPFIQKCDFFSPSTKVSDIITNMVLPKRKHFVAMQDITSIRTKGGTDILSTINRESRVLLRIIPPGENWELHIIISSAVIATTKAAKPSPFNIILAKSRDASVMKMIPSDISLETVHKFLDDMNKASSRYSFLHGQVSPPLLTQQIEAITVNHIWTNGLGFYDRGEHHHNNPQTEKNRAVKAVKALSSLLAFVQKNRKLLSTDRSLMFSSSALLKAIESTASVKLNPGKVPYLSKEALMEKHNNAINIKSLFPSWYHKLVVPDGTARKGEAILKEIENIATIFAAQHTARCDQDVRNLRAHNQEKGSKPNQTNSEYVFRRKKV